MSIQELTLDQIEALVGTRNAVTGIEYPENGMQPYYEWLVRTLQLLSQAATSSAALKVSPDDSGPTVVTIAPGSAVLGGAVMAYAGGTVDLALYNNDVARVWLYDNGGAATVGVAGSVAGWPLTPHLKLAEVTLSAGVITSILDHRMDLTLTDANPVTSVGLTVPSGMAVSGSPVTGSGTLAISFATGQAANHMLATPDGGSGPLGIRALTNGDLPTILVTHGGTGIVSATAHGLVVGNGAANMNVTAAATDGQLFIGATGADPAPQTISGDMTISAAGVVTLTNGSTTRGHLGLGSMATQSASAVAITGGTVTGLGTPSGSGDAATKGYVDAVKGISAVADDSAPALGGDLSVGFHSFTAADASPLLTFSDDSFGNHQMVWGVNVVATGRGFVDSMTHPYLVFDSGGAPSTPVVIQNDGTGIPVLHSDVSLFFTAGGAIELTADSGLGEIMHHSPCYFGKYLRLSAVDGAVVYAQDVPFMDNADDVNTFMVYSTSDMNLYLGSTVAGVVLAGNAFGVFGAAPAAQQPGGVEVGSLTDSTGGTASGSGAVGAIGGGTGDSSAAKKTDVQNAFATVVALINQLVVQVNKQRSLLLTFGWGYDETP